MATEEEEEQYRQLPRGVPTLTYARLLDPSVSPDSSGAGAGQDDLDVDGDFVTVKEPNKALSRYPVAHVFPKGMDDQEFCECTIGQDAGAEMGASLNPLAACVEDATSAVIMLVGSKMTKKWQFLKRIFLPFVANELFACLADKQNQGAEVYEYELTLKAFEIQDEVITDLLRPTTRGLSISVSPDSGVVIQGLQRDRVASEQALRQLFVDSCDNRSSHTLPLGASIDTSSTVWELTLHQKEGDQDVVMQNLSRLLIVDTPAVNPLCMTPSDVKVLDGPNLHKSLFTFTDVSRKLASPQLAALAPYRSSKLTHFLGELLGGNCLVLGLGLVHPGEPAVSKKTLEIIANLTAARHYPISGKETSEIVHGLMIKYRSMLLHMEDELAAVRYQTKNTLANQDSSAELKSTLSPEQEQQKKHNEILNSDYVKQLEAQVIELQKSLVETKLLCEEKGTDASQIYEVLELLKAKYTTLLSELSTQNEKMITIEREKLEVARALVELKLEHSRQMEESEKEKFELTSTVLALKTQSTENDEEIQMKEMELRDTNDKLTESQKWYEKEKEKAVTYHSQLEEVRGQLEKLEARNIEISTELVNLLNLRDTLQRDLDLSLKQVSDMEAVMDTDGNDIMTLRSKNADLEKELLESEQSKATLQSEISHLKLDMERMELEVERSKLDFEKSAGEYLRDKDKVLQQEGHVAKTEIQQLQYEKDQMVVSLRREERLKRDALRALERLQVEQGETKNSLKEAQAESQALREAYRKHLSEVLQGVEKDLTVRDRKKPTFTGVAHGVTAAMNMKVLPSSHSHGHSSDLSESRPGTDGSEYNPASWEAMIDSFLTNERQLYANNDLLSQKNEQLMVAMRELFNRYRQSLDIIEDACPQHLPTDIVTSEAALLLPPNKSRAKGKGRVPGETVVTTGNKSGRTAGGDEIEEGKDEGESDETRPSLEQLSAEEVRELMRQLQTRLKGAEDALLAEQVQSADTCNSYRKTLQRTEKKLADCRQENNFLKERIDIIASSTIVSSGKETDDDAQQLRQLQQLEQKKIEDEKARKREEQRELEFRQQREEYEQRNDAQMAKMYAKLEKQMLELKTASMSAAGNKSVEAELRNQLFIAKQQLETLKAENTQMRTNLLQQPHGVGASKLNKGNSGGGGSERVLELEAYVSQLEANADKGILYQLREVEKRSSSLLSRNAALEQELKSYKVYMRDTLNQNKRQMKALKDQVLQYQVHGVASHHHQGNNEYHQHHKLPHTDVDRRGGDVDANQELLEKYVHLQQQQQQLSQLDHLHQNQPPLLLKQESSHSNSHRSRKFGGGSDDNSVRSQSAGSHLPGGSLSSARNNNNSNNLNNYNNYNSRDGESVFFPSIH